MHVLFQMRVYYIIEIYCLCCLHIYQLLQLQFHCKWDGFWLSSPTLLIAISVSPLFKVVWVNSCYVHKSHQMVKGIWIDLLTTEKVIFLLLCFVCKITHKLWRLEWNLQCCWLWALDKSINFQHYKGQVPWRHILDPPWTLLPFNSERKCTVQSDCLPTIQLLVVHGKRSVTRPSWLKHATIDCR